MHSQINLFPMPVVDTGDHLKKDGGKPRLDLIDPTAITGLARVLTFGANKYSAHGWREGIPNSRIIAALLRHTLALLDGELIDPESGLPHIDHVGCNWMFLSNQMKTRPDLNDLYDGSNAKVHHTTS